MNKLSLVAAIEAFKKGKTKRQVRQFESEIANFIDEQISLKQEEIAKKKRTAGEDAQTDREDFLHDLANLDSFDYDLSSSKSRSECAENYVLSALVQKKAIKAKQDEVDEYIKQREDQIVALKDLRSDLETLSENITLEVDEDQE